MTINTAYLGTPAPMANQSGQTTVLSDLSISGTLDVGPVHASTVAGTTGAFTSTLSTDGAVTIGAGTPLVKLSSITVPMVAITATATKSTTTTYAFSGATTAADATNPQVFIATPTSALSPGVVVDAYASTKDTVTIRYSNCSAANAAVAAHTLRVTMLQF
jgi:hypothetical protein